MSPMHTRDGHGETRDNETLPLNFPAVSPAEKYEMNTLSFDKLNVEITVKQGDTSTERGALLENLAKRILNAMNFEHIETTVRATGMEIDVTGADRQTGQKVLVECKAYRDQTISADVVFKLLGQVQFKGFSSGWLICTSELGKDAKGVREEIRTKPEADRAKIRFYDPAYLISTLVNTGQVIAPTSIRAPRGYRFTRVATLLVTDIGEYWALTAIGGTSGVPDTVLVFDASSGVHIKDTGTVKALSERDSNLKPLTWVAADTGTPALGVISDAALRKELDSIAPVPIADTWSDYRPARPADFVGRADKLKDILSVLEEIRNETSPTRLLAIKAPSGWGKSSFLNKLRSTCANVRHRNRFFLYPVDCRTASSARYPELALKKCFDQAIEASFLPKQLSPISVGSVGDPFSEPTMRRALDYLRSERKVVVLFFDQFEEITSRQDFTDLFIAVRSLCSAVDSAKEAVVLGFSWKTDGTIPTDHPAYHIWHQFADRRREFDLPLFSSGEITRLLNHLSKELGHPIEPSLRRLLAEHCQGYPWLLKKLCIHVFGALKSKPDKQRELLERALNVDALFKEDLDRLQARELACIDRIAKDSPADFYRIENAFGGDTIARLIDKRLVVRSSGKLILYWDIFREYVLTRRAPQIPSRYVPLTGPHRVKEVLSALLHRRSQPLSSLSTRFHLQTGTVDNIARDLVMLGLVQYDRKQQRIRLLSNNAAHVLTTLFTYFRSHAVSRGLFDRFAGTSQIVFDDVVTALKNTTPNEAYSEKTWRDTTRRLLVWMKALGLVRLVGHQVVLLPSAVPPQTLDQMQVESRRSRGTIFKGDAPPLRVLDVIQSMLRPGYIPAPEDRNSLYVLRSLGLIASSADPVLIERPDGDVSLWLASKVLETPSITAAWNFLKDHRDATATELGTVIEEISGHSLAKGSKLRYGASLQVWMRWLTDLVKERLNAVELTLPEAGSPT